jgi:hypothetical protein
MRVNRYVNDSFSQFAMEDHLRVLHYYLSIDIYALVSYYRMGRDAIHLSGSIRSGSWLRDDSENGFVGEHEHAAVGDSGL